MKKLDNFIGLVVTILVIPAILILYYFAPSSADWNGLKLPFNYLSWDTFLWQTSLLLAPFLAIIYILLKLPKKTNWIILFLLYEILFAMTWNLWNTLDDLRFVEHHNLFITALVCFAITGIIIYIRQMRKPTDAEKLERLLTVIDQLTTEDLPQLFVGFLDVGHIADEMQATDYIYAWRRLLKQKVLEGNTVVMATIEKLEKTRNINK